MGKKSIVISLLLLFIPAVFLLGKVVVIPFNGANGKQDLSWLRYGTSIYLTYILSGIEGIDPISWDEFTRYLDDEGIPLDASLTLGSIIKIGRDLGAEKLIIGRYSEESGKLIIRAKVIDIKKGGISHELGSSGRKEDLGRIIDNLASKLITASFPGKSIIGKNRLSGISEKTLHLYALAKLTGEKEKRIALLEKALSFPPDFLPARLELGELYFSSGYYLKAGDTLAKVPPGYPSFATAHFKAGSAYFAGRRYEKALSSFIDSFTAHPTTSSLFNIGASLAYLGKYTEASFFIERVSELYPKEPSFLLSLGYLALREEKLTKAEEYLRRATDIDPSLVPARFLLSRVYERMGRTKEAEDEMLLARGYADSDEILTSLENGDHPFLALMDEEEGEEIGKKLKEEVLNRLNLLSFNIEKSTKQPNNKGERARSYFSFEIPRFFISSLSCL